MKSKQKQLLEEVILPKLVEMASEGTLPMDMTTLNAEHFEYEINAFNLSDGVKVIEVGIPDDWKLLD